MSVLQQFAHIVENQVKRLVRKIEVDINNKAKTSKIRVEINYQKSALALHLIIRYVFINLSGELKCLNFRGKRLLKTKMANM